MRMPLSYLTFSSDDKFEYAQTLHRKCKAASYLRELDAVHEEASENGYH